VYVLEGGIDSLETVQSGREQLVDGEFCHDGNGQVVEAVDYDEGLQEAADTTTVGDGTRDAVIAGDAQSAVDTGSATATTDLEMDVATLRARNDSLCAELEQSRSVEARLTGQLELLREELGESAEKLATFYAREKTDTDEKQQLREEHARLQEEYTRRLRAVQTELQAVRQQQQDNAADARQDLQADVQQLQQDLAEARSQVQTLNNELSAARVDGESQQHEHTAVLQELQEYRGRSVELEARVASLEQELQNGREELERLTADTAAQNP